MFEGVLLLRRIRAAHRARGRGAGRGGVGRAAPNFPPQRLRGTRGSGREAACPVVSSSALPEACAPKEPSRSLLHLK